MSDSKVKSIITLAQHLERNQKYAKILEEIMEKPIITFCGSGNSSKQEMGVPEKLKQKIKHLFMNYYNEENDLIIDAIQKKNE